jgi:hypothetical protein
MSEKRIKGRGFFCLWLAVLFSPHLYAQAGSGQGYDYEDKAIVAILPFIGEQEAAEVFNRTVTDAVAGLQKYSPRNVSRGTVEAAGVRIPTDMPPIRELAPGARFALTGGVYPGNYADESYLQLWLWDMYNSSMIYTDDLVYADINKGLESLPGLVEWLFSHITLSPVESESAVKKGWEEKLIGVGIRSGISQRWYREPDKFAPGAHALNFEGGLFVSVFLNPLLSLQGELNFTFDNLVYRGIDDTGGTGQYVPVLVNEKYTAYSLMFPVIMKVNFRPGNFRLAPFGGIYAFFPLGEASYRKKPAGEGDSFSWSAAAPLGFILGLEGAMKLGPGLLLADLRCGGDFGVINIHDADTAYSRGIISVTLGYAFGFINTKKP